jgi:hypothetical protein
MAQQEQKKSGYEKIYDWVVESLPKADLEANAPHLDLKVHPEGGVIVSLFGRDYLVDKTGARPMDGGKASFTSRSLVAHYAMSSGRAEPSLSFVTLNTLAKVPAGTANGSLQKEAISAPLVRKFGSDLAGLEEAVKRLGGRPEPVSQGGSHGYIFFPFPKIPLKLVFQEPDDEFEAEFSILYDSRGREFFEFEALAFLGGVLLDELLSHQR